MNSLIIFNVKMILPDRITPGAVLVEKGSIVEVVENTANAAGNTGGSAIPAAWKNRDGELIDGEGLYLSPGFIDLHNHGRL
ncbi:MAG: hypothetical protein LBH07_03330, partial [Treponema sp.]|nr:hypothetical protein [Treponema sp.]